MEITLSEDMLEDSIENMMQTFECNRYSAEKLFNKVRMEVVQLTEKLEYTWSHEVYHAVTHLLINTQIQVIDNVDEYESLDDIADYLCTIDPELIGDVLGELN